MDPPRSPQEEILLVQGPFERRWLTKGQGKIGVVDPTRLRRHLEGEATGNLSEDWSYLLERYPQLALLEARAWAMLARIRAKGIPFRLARWAEAIAQAGEGGNWALPWSAHIHPRSLRLHPEWDPLGTVTGRIISRNPNIQTLPREGGWRRAVQAPPGQVLVGADWRGAELVALAGLSGSQGLMRELRGGGDPHRRWTELLLGRSPTPVERHRGKGLVFGLIYGMGRKAALGYLREHFPGLDGDQALERLIRELEREEFWAWRRRVMLEGTSSPLGRQLRGQTPAERINRPLQAAIAEVLKTALVRLGERRWIPILLLHDEIVLEVEESRAEAALRDLQETMKQASEEILGGCGGVKGWIRQSWSTTPD